MEGRLVCPTMKPKRIAISGSTGSIGRQGLDVISAQDDLCVCALGAGCDWETLAEQAGRFRPRAVAIANESAAERLRGKLGDDVQLFVGEQAMTEAIRLTKPDVVLSGVVGAAGLEPTLAAIECGATLALANKETLVMAGAIVIPAAMDAGAEILPVDSEHSAIFQCLSAGKHSEVARVVITASGGALRNWEPSAVENASVDDALKHPTWQMGRKITIDSATLVNKALEIVEAHWLFDLPAEKIDVVLHPESIVHSYVEYCDGSVIAQMGLPDMATPIAYALNYPRRPRRKVAPLDLAKLGKLTFLPVEGRFKRAVNLGFEAIRRGGTAGAVLNAANEAAVEAFLERKIPFGKIVPMVEDILSKTEPKTEITLQALLTADKWARNEVKRRA